MSESTIAPVPVPLWWDEHGRLMIVGHRIAFETIVHHYRRSRSAEAVRHSYPALPLADIHVLLAYYLRHQDEIDDYVAERGRLGEEARARHEAEHLPEPELRAKLLARLDEHQRSGRAIGEIIAAEGGPPSRHDPR